MGREMCLSLSISISKKLRIFSPLALIFLGILISIAALEICFRSLPVNMGLIRADPPSQWPLYNYRPHANYSYSKNWSLLNPQYGVTNNYGHLAPFDFNQKEEIIAVIGDSYVEARMNRYEDTIQGQLKNFIPTQIPVYGLAANGLSIADYLVLSQQTTQEFKPTAFLYVLVDNDLSEATRHRKGWHHFSAAHLEWPLYVPEREGYRPWYSDFLAASALYRYLKGNLGLTFPQPFAVSHSSVDKSSMKPDTEQEFIEHIAIKQFLEMLPRVTGLAAECHIFLIDADRYAIYDQKNASIPFDSPLLKQFFIGEAKERKMTIIDLKLIFVEDYTKRKDKFDFFPNDRHWNRRGHLIAAEAAARALIKHSEVCLPNRDAQAPSAASNSKNG